MESCEVSIIITTRNEEKNIGGCLKSIQEQSYPLGRIETIVVDNDSNDATKDKASFYTNKIYNYGPERSAQRNYGAKQATGKYLLFLDADMLLSRDVVAEGLKKLERGDCFSLYIPERIIGGGFWIKVRDFERSFYNGTCIDCVRFVHRDKFLEIGGFDETLTGPEDWDFDRRIRAKGKSDFITAVIYHNEGSFNIGKYINKKIYYTKSFREYVQKWGKDDQTIKKQLGFWYRFFGVYTEEGKWKKIIMHPILAFGLYFLRCVLGFRYLFLRG